MRKDKVMRGMSITEEVVKSRKTHELVTVMMQGCGLDSDCECDRCEKEFNLGMTAYLNGIRVGMEMERTELCEPS